MRTLPAAPIQWLDLAPDQCTMYFTAPTSTRIRKFDVCAGTLLPDLATATQLPSSVRVLSDGSVLVAGSTAVFRYSPTGAIITEYTPPVVGRYNGIALDVDGRSIWIGGGGNVSRVDVASGSLAQTIQVDPNVAGPIQSIAVIGEPRAALSPSNIPMLSPLLLILLAGVLCTVGLLVLRST